MKQSEHADGVRVLKRKSNYPLPNKGVPSLWRGRSESSRLHRARTGAWQMIVCPKREVCSQCQKPDILSRYSPRLLSGDEKAVQTRRMLELRHEILQECACSEAPPTPVGGASLDSCFPYGKSEFVYQLRSHWDFQVFHIAPSLTF